MKQKILNLKSWLLLMLMCVSMGAWAEDETIASFSFTTKNGSIPSGWSGTGTGNTSTGAYYFLGNDGNLTSPAIDFTKYSKITIEITARRYGSWSNENKSKAAIQASIGSSALGSSTLTGTSLVKITNIEVDDLSSFASGSITFTCPLAEATNIGAGVSAITIKGTKIPQETYSVAFNAGTNGTCSTTSLTEVSAGSGVTLPSCTPNTGYAFLGWTVTEDKTTIDTGLTPGTTYKPSADITLYAVYAALYQVTIEEPTYGTLSVKCAGKDVTSGEYYAVGQTINIVATPNEGYKFRNLQVVDASTHTFTASNEKDWTMGDHEITIKANFDEIVYRTITWSVNGNTTKIVPTQVGDGENITFPTGLDDVYGKKFVGWSANENASSADDLVVGKVPATADATYFAVFADVVKSGESEIILDYKNVHSAYTTDNVDRNMQDVDGFKYYGCMQGKESGSSVASILQMRKTSNNEITSWIYNSTALDIKKLEITYTSSNNKLCDVFFGDAENPSEDAASCDGEANAAGKNIFTNADGCKYFRIENPKNGAIYISKIVVYCNDEEVTNYTTTVAPIYTLDELSNVSRGEHVNVAVDAEITSVSRTNPVDNLYQVIIKSENNNTVILKIDDADFNWLVGGRVTGTLYDVEWSGVDRGWFISGKSNDYWKALEYTAPVVNTYESIEALRAANLDDNTTVNVTLNDKIANVELDGDTYYVTLDNDLQIVSVTYRDLGWEIGGSISGTLNNVVYSNSGSVDGVLDLNGAYKSLTYTAPAPTVPTFASLDDLIAANLEESTVVNVTINNGVMMGMPSPTGEGYVVFLDNEVVITAPGSGFGGVPVMGGTVSGQLTNVTWDPEEYTLQSETEFWTNLTYTPGALKETITVNAACNDGEFCYATYSSANAFYVPKDLVVYEVMADDSGIALEAYKTDNLVPSYTGVLICAAEGGDYEVEIETDPEIIDLAESVLGESNALRYTCIPGGITAEDMADNDPGMEYYRLTMQNGTKCGFWWGAEKGAAFSIAENKAYLVAPKSAKIKGFAFGDLANAVKNAMAEKAEGEVRYNLNGQRVNANAKGIIIVNGKKVIKK